MRILHILNEIREIGNGIVNVTVDLSCLQAKDGHKVVVASAGGEYETLLANCGVSHFALDQTRKPTNLFKVVKRYQALVQEFQPDIVHAHMMTGIVLAKVLRARTTYGLISTVHNEFQKGSILMGLADRVIAVSESVAQSMNRRGISQNKLRVVYNGTLGSPRTRKIAEYSPLPLKRPSITTVAGMYQRKGITELINAFMKVASDFPEAHLYLVGDGPDRKQFEAQSLSTHVANRIHFEKFQPEPQRYLLATDIFVLASHREPFGLVLSEAREAGCAIVASHVDGIPEALEFGKAGLLVSPGNVAELAKALARLLSDSNALHNWKYKTQKNLEWLKVRRVHEQTLAVYQEVLAKHN